MRVRYHFRKSLRYRPEFVARMLEAAAGPMREVPPEVLVSDAAFSRWLHGQDDPTPAQKAIIEAAEDPMNLPFPDSARESREGMRKFLFPADQETRGDGQSKIDADDGST